jgi:hypothetical protein
MNKTKNLKIGFGFGVAVLGLLTGCIGYMDGPRAHVYAPPPSVYVEAGVAAQDDYVYYPGYQVYYSSYRHQYIYLDGRSWVSRSAPPRVSVDVLFASPSVKVDFHDSPANHHTTVVRSYPRNWAPPGANHGNKEGWKEDRKDNRKNDKKEGDQL